MLSATRRRRIALPPGRTAAAPAPPRCRAPALLPHEQLFSPHLLEHRTRHIMTYLYPHDTHPHESCEVNSLLLPNLHSSDMASECRVMTPRPSTVKSRRELAGRSFNATHTELSTRRHQTTDSTPLVKRKPVKNNDIPGSATNRATTKALPCSISYDAKDPHIRTEYRPPLVCARETSCLKNATINNKTKGKGKASHPSTPRKDARHQASRCCPAAASSS